jgi:hypothetical protein
MATASLAAPIAALDLYCIVLTCVLGDKLGGGVRGRGAAQRVRSVVGVLIQSDVVYAHLGGEIATPFEPVGQGTLALCS